MVSFPCTKGRANMTTTEKLPMVTRADWVPGPKQGWWTYSDYAALPDDGRQYEIVNGVLYMAPSPSTEHQKIAGRFFYYLFTHVELAGLGSVLSAPTDVVLSPIDVFQPDVLVILNAGLEKIKELQVIGAPDLVVEVASPRSSGGYIRDHNGANSLTSSILILRMLSNVNVFISTFRPGHCRCLCFSSRYNTSNLLGDF